MTMESQQTICGNPLCGRPFKKRPGTRQIYCTSRCVAQMDRIRKGATPRGLQPVISASERVRRRQGYQVGVCPRCRRKQFYTDVSIAGERGFAQCVACGYSPTLAEQGYGMPSHATAGIRRAPAANAKSGV